MIGIDDAMMAAIAGGAQGAMNLGTSFVNQAFGNYNRKKNAEQSFKSYTKQGLFDYQLANGPYFDLAQRYNEANYNLSRRYAENSAKWATTGLRKAGLNPILAASQGFNAQTGAQGAQMSPSSSSSPSFNQSTAVHAPDIMEGLRDMSSARLTDANAKLVQTQADNIEAQTANTLIDAINKAEHKGLSGNIGGLAGLLNNALTELTGSTGSVLQDAVLDKVSSKYANDVKPNASASEKKEVKRKAERWLSDIIKEEEDKKRKADFQNHYNHMLHGNGVMHMGH